MKLWNYLYITAFVIFMTACSNPVFVQKDDTANFSNYHTYMWIDTKASQDDNSAKTNANAEISVRNAVNSELADIGWKEVSESPDVLLSYDVLVRRTTQQQSDPIYSQPFSRVYYNPFSRRWNTIYYPSDLVGFNDYSVRVKEGTITISMIDANTDKRVWQGWTTETLDYSRLTDEEISRSVKNIFNKFDVASR